ncbi:hypothetical protein [Flavobacterium sp. C4GT6]|uniref:hypothetical protein n=1 Tax=Flavobacterium sp. C4GT6 TaxID=3103818 RepID=UPI002ED66859
MTLNELIELFITSDKSDWNQISTWGYGSGPSYKNQFEFSEINNNEENVLTHKEHSNVASFKKNLSITIAWGLKSGDEDSVIDRPWATNNPNPSPGIPKYLDFFYNNALVLRVSYCVIDGGRCQLPFPDYDMEQNITVPRKYYEVIKKLNQLTNTSFFDSYFTSSGITINEEEW